MRDLSPCVQRCKLDADKEVCIGCHRTKQEIGSWSSLDMSDRTKIMQELSDRKRKLMKGAPCPSCGLDNNCYMEQGKSATLCWCMSEEPNEVTNGCYDVCYCKQCLSNLKETK